jgi:acyl-CoA thioester hydrolase
MPENSKKSIELEMIVSFYDLDPMQIVWHGNYLKYMDDARGALFDSLGVDLFGLYEETRHIYPIIKTSVKHVFPLRHKDAIICRATLVEAKYKIIVDFEIRLKSDNRICARGRSEQVAVKMPEMEMLILIPDEVRRLLEA